MEEFEIQNKLSRVTECVEEQNFSSKGIHDIEDLTNLYNNPEKNENINISNNSIQVIPQSFGRFINLRFLDLSNNRLYDIEFLKACTKIETLKLANNEIKLTRSIVYLKVLQSLDLSNNKVILDQVFIKNLRINPELLSLKLEGNINYNFERIRNYCLESLPKLLYLDSHKICNSPKNKKFQPVSITCKLNDGNNRKIKKLSEYIKLKKTEISNDSKYETDHDKRLTNQTGTDTKVLNTEVGKSGKKLSVLEMLKKENEALRKRQEAKLNPNLKIKNNKYKIRPMSQYKGKAALYTLLYLDMNNITSTKSNNKSKKRGNSQDNNVESVANESQFNDNYFDDINAGINK